MSDITNLGSKTALNTKTTKIKSIMRDITNVVTKAYTEVDTEVTEIENEVCDVTSFLSTTEAGCIIKDVDSNKKEMKKASNF